MNGKKVLLINSDLAKNRGDRAIAEGMIQLIKESFPEAHITGLSEQAQRDREWFGIDFLPQDSQSLHPLDFMRLMRAARNADIILWGGGEILKDYTNKLALWYWALKVGMLSKVNRNIYGAYQGIGPTKSASSKRVIAWVVRQCRGFVVRDHESAEKLIAWGVPAAKVTPSSDPAVLPQGQTLSDATRQKLLSQHDIDQAFLDNFVLFGPRSWFHYKTGGLVPFRYKKALLKLVGKELGGDNPRYTLYRERLVAMVDRIVSEQDTNVLLVPMHMTESDPALCQYLAEHTAHPAKVRMLADDTWSPRDIRDIMAHAKAMVGFRLHSTIIATSSGTPSLNIYYVDKGRLYFEQIKQSRYSLPIEQVLDDTFLDTFSARFAELYTDRETIKKATEQSVDALRAKVREAFEVIESK